jgi:hypothetical protein
MFAKSYVISSLILASLLLFETSSFAKEPNVTGRVTYKGKPVEKGRILFHLEDGQFVGAKINDEGKFVVKAVPKGTRTVTIEGKDIPEKYKEAETSSLQFMIVEGANTLDLDLK